jgi:hypothetical protein
MPRNAASEWSIPMKNFIVLKAVSAAILCITLAVAPQSVVAQRGGHGGGGGFHGGGGFAGGGGYHGGGGGYHGGGGFASGGYRGVGYHGGGYHGGGYYGGGHGGYGGWHGSYGGWGGGYWGYPGYAWGFGLSFGWGPYWGSGYPYVYGYGGAWAPAYYPYCYSYSYPYCYSYVPSGYIASYAEPDNSSSNYASASYAPSRASAPAPRNTTVPTSPTIKYASYRPPAASHGAGPASPIASSYRPVSRAEHQLRAVRPEVQNVIRALRGMPPGAREREIDSGRYGNLSPQELRFVRYAADLPPA